MKKTIFIAVLLTVISAVSFAGVNNLSETTKFQVVENSDSHYDLYYVSENVDNVLVRIVNEDGGVVTTDKIQEVRAFKRTYDFNALPTGNYSLEIKNNEGEASQAIFHNPIKYVNLHSIVGKLPKENKFKVFVGPSDSKAPIKVTINDQNGSVLLKETINGADGFSKIYDLRDITGDYVTFHLSKDQEEVSATRALQ